MEKKKVSEFGTPLELIPEGWIEIMRRGRLYLRVDNSGQEYAAYSATKYKYESEYDDSVSEMPPQNSGFLGTKWLQYQCARMAPVQKPVPSITTGPAIDLDKQRRLDGYMRAIISGRTDVAKALNLALACMSAVDEHLTYNKAKAAVGDEG